jgi:hypothetical protein
MPLRNVCTTFCCAAVFRKRKCWHTPRSCGGVRGRDTNVKIRSKTHEFFILGIENSINPIVCAGGRRLSSSPRITSSPPAILHQMLATLVFGLVRVRGFVLLIFSGHLTVYPEL